MSEKNITIRLETKDDYKAVENLTREAFWNVYRPGCMEHYLLHCYRDDPAFVPAKTKGVRYADDPEADYFLIKELTPGFLEGISGTYKDPEGYFVCEKNPEAFEQFEATFPKKEKQSSCASHRHHSAKENSLKVLGVLPSLVSTSCCTSPA